MICPDCGTETSLDVCLCGAVLKNSSTRQPQAAKCALLGCTDVVHGPKFTVCTEHLNPPAYLQYVDSDPSAEQIETTKRALKNKTPYG